MTHPFQEWQVRPGILTFESNQLRCLRMGSGKKVLIAFHGFGQDASVFEPLAKWVADEYTVVALDFPGESAGLWKNKRMPPTVKVLSYFVQRICNELEVEKVSLLGFSMGARPALCLTGYLPEKIEKLVLLAPDGLQKNIWYSIATRSVYGRLLFKQVVRHPERWERYLGILVKRGLVKERWQHLVRKTLREDRYREQLLTGWLFTRNCIPDPAFVQKKIKKWQIPIHLLFGERDTAFPPKEGRRFVQDLPTGHVYALDCGHHLLNSKCLSDVASAVLL